MREVLHSILSSYLPFQTDAVDLKKIKNVLLADASIVRQEGKQQKQQRIYMCFSFNHNQMQQVKVTKTYTAEILTYFSRKKGYLVMADAGYGTAHNDIYAQEYRAAVILRITPKCFCLYDADGTKISFLLLLKQAEVFLWLILWAITKRQSFLAEYFLDEKKKAILFSVYEKYKLAFLQIKETVCLS